MLDRKIERPFAEQAYHLCVRSGHHDYEAWFCEHCRLIEMRLTPIFDMPGMREILAEIPPLKIALHFGEDPDPPDTIDTPTA